MAIDILIEGAMVLDAHDEAPRMNQHIAITGGRIAQVSAVPLKGDPRTRRIQGRDRLVIPGLVNAHTHSPENLYKGWLEALPLELWLFYLFWPPFTLSPREIALASLVGAIEMLKSGTTALVDHFWLNGALALEALEAVMAAYQEVGIRAGVAPLVEDDHKINQLLCQREPDLAEAPWGTMPPITADEYLRLLEAFFDTWHGAQDGRLRCLAGPSGAQWCTLEVLRGAMEIARRHGGGFHMHVNETRFQAQLCEAFFGRTTVAYLDEEGLLGPETSLAHCVWITPEDAIRIARSGATVVHNPVCNLKLGSGFAPILDLDQQGAHIALAADGAASNDNQNMFDVMKAAGLMHTVGEPDHRKWLRARRILEMATRGGARVLGMADELGLVRPGQLADLVILDLTTPAFSPLNDPVQHLVYTEKGASVRTVIVHGRVVVDEGRIETVDERALLAEARSAWARRRAEVPALDERARRFLAAQERLRRRVLEAEAFTARA